MEAQDKLINYLKAKRTKTGQGDLFFNKKDEKDINGWSDKEAKEIWDAIVDIINNGGAKNLGANTCPFCYKYERISYTKSGSNFNITNNEGACDRCSYGKRHGICYNLDKSPDNDFYKMYVKDSDIDSKFDNSDYKALLDGIEES